MEGTNRRRRRLLLIAALAVLCVIVPLWLDLARHAEPLLQPVRRLVGNRQSAAMSWEIAEERGEGGEEHVPVAALTEERLIERRRLKRQYDRLVFVAAAIHDHAWVNELKIPWLAYTRSHPESIRN